MDSWDTGSQTGANDDGGGFITCFEALRVIQKLGLKPRRTMRMIGWSGEEFGAPNNGAIQYTEQHKDELEKHIIAFESDLGSARPYGFGFTGSDEAMAQIEYITEEFLSNMTTKIVKPGGTMADTEPLSDYGVPTIKNLVDDINAETHPYYFTFHHSAGDSMDILDPEQMDENVMAIAAMMFIIADMEPTLPR